MRVTFNGIVWTMLEPHRIFFSQCGNAIVRQFVAMRKGLRARATRGTTSTSSVSVAWGMELAWLWLLRIAAIVAASAMWLTTVGVFPARSQVVLPLTPEMESPWNTQRVFETVPFAQRWAMSGVDEMLPEDTPVKTRIHPGYEAVGIRAGKWMFVPSVSVGGYYTSNAFASPTNPQSDTVLQVRPTLRAYTLTEGNTLAVQADMQSDTYRRNSGLDQIDANIRARGKLELWHNAALLTNFRAARLHDAVGSLSSPAGAVEPTPYTYITGDATYWQQFNRLAVSAGARIDSYKYGSTRAADGSTIDQDSRSGEIYVGHGRVEYTLVPSFGVFAAAEGNRRELKGTPTTPLSSDGYRVLGGINFEFSRLIWGEFGVGYMDQQFDAPTIQRIAGPAYRGLLVWRPTRTVDVKFKAESTVTQAVDTDATGIRADSVQVGLDYEFRRNVVFSLAATYERDRFVGQFREDTVYATLAEVKYLLNRHWSISARHQYINRDSNIPTFVYDKHEIGINVAAQF